MPCNAQLANKHTKHPQTSILCLLHGQNQLSPLLLQLQKLLFIPSSCASLLFFLVNAYLTSATTKLRKLCKYLHNFKCANKPNRAIGKVQKVQTFEVQELCNGLEGWQSDVGSPSSKLFLTIQN